MKNSLWVLVLLMATSCNASHRTTNTSLEGKWYIELQQTDIGIVRTIMTFETDDSSFIAYTRKKADKDILGGWTAMLGRTFTSSFKEGSLLRIEQGIFTTRNDTLKIAGILSSAIGKYNINGYIINNEMHARIGNKKHGYRGVVKGSRSVPALPFEDYQALFEKAVALTKNKIYNRKLLLTKEWKNFTTAMRNVSANVQDDLEMVFAFFYYADKLPLSHYALMKIPETDNTTPAPQSPHAFLTEKTAHTAYLKISSFAGSAAEIDSIFTLIRRKGYTNLVIDLRNNPGGSIEAGMAFATNIADTTFYGGIFLTQEYFNIYSAPPVVADYPRFEHFTDANYDLVIEGIHNKPGLCLKIIPKGNTYRSNLYILTNNRTASTCEPIVYGLQQQNLATIVGERTAGAMLNGEMFELDKDFKMVIPTADYYTSDGYRIDQAGVEPDIKVKQEEALEYVMNNMVK